MFDPVNGASSFFGDLFETNPNQHGTPDMVALASAGLATLTAFDAGELFAFAVKLLNLPTQGTRLLCDLRVVLSQVVGDDIVRAQGHPSVENTSRKSFTRWPLGKPLR